MIYNNIIIPCYIRRYKDFCIPLTLSNPLKVCSSYKKYLIIIQSIRESIFLNKKPEFNGF